MVFGYQLDGEWVTHHHGLPFTVPAARVKTVLAPLKKFNVAVNQYGAVNYTNPDGYQDMMLWSLPAAIAGQRVDSPCQPGGLVDRMLQAGRGGD
jgi:hypothetical protein